MQPSISTTEHEAYRRGFDAGRLHVVQTKQRTTKPRWALGFGTFTVGLISVAAVVASRRSDDTGDIFAGFAIVAGVGVAMASAMRVVMGDETATWGF